MKVKWFVVKNNGPVLDSEAIVDEKTLNVSWEKQSEFVKSILASGPIYMLGENFDPQNINHWKAMPYIYHGSRFYATLEGADPVIPHRKAQEVAVA